MTTTTTTPMTTPRSPGKAAADRAHANDLEPVPEIDMPQIDMEEHRQTYRWFVRGALLFAAHAVGILLVLAYVFSDGFG